MIEELLENSDIVIHYVTSDPEDQVFQIRHERFKAYYIGRDQTDHSDDETGL